MNVRPIHAKCRNCGRPIFLVKTTKGKTLPCDRVEELFVISASHSSRFVTQSGEVYTGTLATDGDKDYDRMTGWPCHNDTCPKRGAKK